jgi:alkylation response protein AidB-like acyl-CoA dehydrogenase
MNPLSHLTWPFFDDHHRSLGQQVRQWAERELGASALAHGESDLDQHCRDLVRRLGAAAWLRWAVPDLPSGWEFDLRSFCIVREVLASYSPLADFAFAMQGLGTGPVALFGTPAQCERWLPPARSGEQVAAFAISEAEAGSDVAAMSTTARQAGGEWVIDGEKTWISNAGIADHYIVFARWLDGGERSFVALMVPADTPGCEVTARLATMAPHPLGVVTFSSCRVPGDALIGEAGRGLRVALGTLDVFRAGVAAAAVGMARRALAEAIGFAQERQAFGSRLAEFQLTRGTVADLATALDAAALLVYRAAWIRDQGAERVTCETAMAKLFATEEAQRIIDGSLQLLGGRGVMAGSPVEQLYREIRALRIYEGTSEIQRLVIGRQILESEGRS